jgi:hypothetical protein
VAIAEHISGGYDVRHLTMLLMSGALAASLLAGCSDDSTTAPNTGGGGIQPPPTTGTPSTPTNGGTPVPPPTGESGIPASAAITVGDIFFKSDLNGSSNPAVDTVAINGIVTWTWATGETLPHSVQSTGSSSFTSSDIQTGGGKTYQFQFTSPGTYQYDCAVHGQMMTGTIVVMPPPTA